jgi:hypothetical protein
MGRDFIDLSLGKAPKQPENNSSQQKAVYLTSKPQNVGF